MKIHIFTKTGTDIREARKSSKIYSMVVDSRKAIKVLDRVFHKDDELMMDYLLL